MVERSDVDLHISLLLQVDTAAHAIFRGWDRSAGIEETGDEYCPAAIPGLWAGGHDEMGLEPAWNQVNACGRLPISSARIDLSEAELRPAVWLRGKNDPTCRIM